LNLPPGDGDKDASEISDQGVLPARIGKVRQWVIKVRPEGVIDRQVGRLDQKSFARPFPWVQLILDAAVGGGLVVEVADRLYWGFPCP
jgi:hypothetical protein